MSREETDDPHLLQAQGARTGSGEVGEPGDEERERALGAAALALTRAAGDDILLGDDVRGSAEHLVRYGSRLIPQADCLLAVVDAKRQDVLQVVSASGPWAQGLMGTEWPLEGTLALRAMQDGTAVELTGIQASAEAQASFLLPMGDIDTVRLVPLKSSEPLPDGRVALGVFGVYRRVADAFTAAQRQLIDDYARLVSGSLHRAALREAAVLAADEVRRASRAKSDLMNTVAHELRAPLTVISGYVSLLDEGSYGPPSEQWRAPVAILASKAEELRKLVEDLLLASRIESGTIPLTMEPIDLREAVRDAVARAEARAVLLGAKLVQEVPDHPVMVEADLTHLDRILDNLVNNALAYGGEQPWVRVLVTNTSVPRVAVEDRGPGVNPTMRERIFERFVRAEERSSKPGTGLGLYISRQLAERQGGKLILESSEPGKGARFALHLPPMATAA